MKMKMCASSKKLIAHMKFELQKNSAGTAFDAALPIYRNGKPTGRSLNYADLDNGMEIKVLNSASSYNTINGHLKNASKKLNATSVVFDNSENKCLTDEKLAEYLRRSQAFKYGSVCMLTCENRLIRIK